jgi:hypothetical protein
MWSNIERDSGHESRRDGFPCIYGERVGLGRSYVKLDGKPLYDEW